MFSNMNEIIKSQQNPLVKKIIRLKRENYRKKEGIVVIEGEKEVEMAKISNISIETAIICDDYNFKRNIVSGIPSDKVHNVSKIIFKKLSNRENPDGVIVLANIKEKTLDNLDIKEKVLILAVEGIEKPGNLGAIIRSVDAVGANAVVVLDSKLDIYNPNVIRTSRGSLFTVPVICSSICEFEKWAKKNEIIIFAATPHESNIYTNESYKERSVIMLGNEHNGLSYKALNIANNKIKIPMMGSIDSLNVSVSAAILLYEALRQKLQK